MQYFSFYCDSRLTAERVNATSIRLYIRRIHEGDSGLYSCVARTADATVTQDAELLIYGMSLASSRYNVKNSRVMGKMFYPSDLDLDTLPLI